MFPRRQRLRNSEAIQWVLAHGQRRRGKFLQLVYWLAPTSEVATQVSETGGAAYFTVIVGAKQLRKAVERNRLKRRYRALARKHQARWPVTAAVILLPNAAGLTVAFTDLEQDYLKALPAFSPSA